jgi:hypothetical protein
MWWSKKLSTPNSHCKKKLKIWKRLDLAALILNLKCAPLSSTLCCDLKEYGLEHPKVAHALLKLADHYLHQSNK